MVEQFCLISSSMQGLEMKSSNRRLFIWEDITISFISSRRFRFLNINMQVKSGLDSWNGPKQSIQQSCKGYFKKRHYLLGRMKQRRRSPIRTKGSICCERKGMKKKIKEWSTDWGRERKEVWSIKSVFIFIFSPSHWILQDIIFWILCKLKMNSEQFWSKKEALFKIVLD